MVPQMCPFRPCLARLCSIEWQQFFDVASAAPSGDANTVSPDTTGNVCVAVFFWLVLGRWDTQPGPDVAKPLVG
jgi:hypothetical protein